MSRSMKKTGEIGHTKISSGLNGQKATLIPTVLPTNKEDLELTFATWFLEQFNKTQPLGQDLTIRDFEQNDTSDLDFSISCEIANYLELAELSPLSESFGRRALRTGELNVYEFARWIYFRVIQKKSKSYGTTAHKTILLLYVTHWQFAPSDKVVECLNSLVQHNSCDFAAVFAMLTNGSDLRLLSPIHPYLGPKLSAPKSYKLVRLKNLEPGNYEWKIDRF